MTDLETICILTTVNAPYATPMDAAELARALQARDVSRGQVASFLTEVPEADQLAFAAMYGIDRGELTTAARILADWSGQSVPLAA